MIVEIKSSAVNTKNSDYSQQDFDKLIQTLTYKNRYCLLLKDKSILNSQFIKNTSNNNKEIINQLFTSSINISNKADCTIVGKTNEIKRKEFSVTESIIYFETPLEILLENCNNDSYFITAIFNAFKPSLNIKEKLKNNWIKYSGNGGCTSIKDIINRQLRSNDYIPKMLRFYVILDSDKHFKNDNTFQKKYNLEIKLFNKNNIPYHILEKRCFENYLPLKAYDFFKTTQNKNWLKAFEYLTEEQKDFIDISRGYSTDAGKNGNIDNPDRLSLENKNPQEAKFIKNISEENFKILWKGLNIPSFKTNFPTAFDTHSVHKETLNERTAHQNNPDELQQIVEEIIKLL